MFDILIQDSTRTITNDGRRSMLIACLVMCFTLLQSALSIQENNSDRSRRVFSSVRDNKPYVRVSP